MERNPMRANFKQLSTAARWYRAMKEYGVHELDIVPLYERVREGEVIKYSEAIKGYCVYWEIGK